MNGIDCFCLFVQFLMGNVFNFPKEIDFLENVELQFERCFNFYFWNKVISHLQHKDVRHYSIAYLLRSFLILSLCLVMMFFSKVAPSGAESHLYETYGHIKIGLVADWGKLKGVLALQITVGVSGLIIHTERLSLVLPS